MFNVDTASPGPTASSVCRDVGPVDMEGWCEYFRATWAVRLCLLLEYSLQYLSPGITTLCLARSSWDFRPD